MNAPDLNGDGRPDIAVRDGSVDLAVSNAATADVSVLLGNGDGTLQPARAYPISGPDAGIFSGSLVTTAYPVQFAPWATDVADFNGDGRLDLAVANSFPASVSVLFGLGDGRFAPETSYGM